MHLILCNVAYVRKTLLKKVKILISNAINAQTFINETLLLWMLKEFYRSTR